MEVYPVAKQCEGAVEINKTILGLEPVIGLIVISSPLEVGADKAVEMSVKAESMLSNAGVDVQGTFLVDNPGAARAAGSSFAGVDVICAVAATWCEDYLVQDVLAAIESPTPVITWGVPGLHTGSLCGTHQLCCVLKEIRIDYKFVYGELDDPNAIKRTVAYAKACAARKKLRSSRIGRIGARTAGMTEVTLDELELRSLFGPRLVERGLDWLEEQVHSADTEEAEDLWKRISPLAGSVGVPDSEGILAMKHYLALKDFITEEDISAFAIQCYPKLMGRVCVPIAMLAEEDIVGACEGDVNSALAMRLLSWFSAGPIHNTDLLADDPADNSAVFSHCGSGAFCLAGCRSDIILDSCRLMDIGVTVQYPGRPGRVTLLNIVGRRGTYRMGVVSGEAVPTELVFPGNPVKVCLDVPMAAYIEDVATLGLGHHWMICEGDVTAELSEFANLTRVPLHYPGK